MHLETVAIDVFLASRERLSFAISSGLKPDHFEDEKCRKTYAILMQAESRGLEPSLTYVISVVGGNSEFLEWLFSRGRGSKDPSNAENFIERIKTAAWRRDVLRAVSTAKDVISNAGEAETDAIRSSLVSLADLALPNLEASRIKPFQTVALDDFEHLESQIHEYNAGKVSGIPTGIGSLDDYISGGWQKCGMYIIAGRTGTGKSSLAVTATLGAARAGFNVCYCTIELSAEQISRKMVSADAKIVTSKTILGRLRDDEIDHYSASIERLTSKCNIFVFDRFSNDFETMMAELDRYMRVCPLDLIIVDGVQLLRAPGKRWERRTSELTYISNRLKSYALNKKTTIVAVAQINRAAMREDSGPELHHLKDCGSFEEDCDCAVIIHHEEDKDDKGKPTGDVNTYLRLRKNRWGQEGDIHVGCDLSISSFFELGKR